MAASKILDILGHLPGNKQEQADAVSAYTQALMGGTETWIEIPRERWPECAKGMNRPCFKLNVALYGHPQAASFWEQHCKSGLAKAGFEAMHD